jgi:amino acid transporter
VRDLTPGDYVLGDIAVIESDKSTADLGADGVELDVPGPPRDANAEFEMGPELENYNAQLAQERERNRIAEILEQRPRRLERSLIRELWSCVVADKKGSDSSD